MSDDDSDVMICEEVSHVPVVTPARTRYIKITSEHEHTPNKIQSESAEKIRPLYHNKPQMDHTSEEGKFSWLVISNKFCLPQIMRKEEDGSSVGYISVKMAEKGLLDSFLKTLPSEVVTIPQVMSYRVAANERRLLLEINSGQCDSYFWDTDAYFYDHNYNDLLILSQDLCQYYTFLKLCLARISGEAMDQENKFGFLRINSTSDVPYVAVEGQKYIPLFYFEEEGTGEVSPVRISGWDWAYLRFCCKVQGVKESMLVGTSCSCISEKEFKEMLPGGTTFQEYWPEKNYLKKAEPSNVQTLGWWTRKVLTVGERFEGKLVPVKEFPPTPLYDGNPYRAELACIKEKKINCINIQPYSWNEVMVTLPHLVLQIFPGFSDKQIGELLVRKGVTLHQGNSGHNDVIRSQGWQDKYEELPLVTVKDLLKNIEEVNNSLLSSESQDGEKRSKGN